MPEIGAASLENGVSIFARDERPRRRIVVVEIVFNRREDAFTGPAANSHSSDFGEPAYHEIDPRTARRNEVEVHAGCRRSQRWTGGLFCVLRLSRMTWIDCPDGVLVSRRVRKPDELQGVALGPVSRAQRRLARATRQTEDVVPWRM